MAKSKRPKASVKKAKKENEIDAAEFAAELDTGARNPTNWSGQLITAVALIWAVFQIYIASNAPFFLAEITGSNIFVMNSDQTRAIHLALALFLGIMEAGVPQIPGVIRWLDTGGRSVIVLEDQEDVTIVWLLDALEDGASEGGSREAV